ncbi:MAG: carnitinyl-coA dehydratase [Ramlibacter sp.]|nr:carnitinyl-coA dehydratase [Ramlibacter sp.]
MTGDLLVEENGPVAVISFNRPAARNALTLAMLNGLAEALRRCASRTDLRAVVLRGTGEMPFSAGYNIDELPGRTISTEEARTIHAPVREVADAILACPHPVVGAARRFVFGAALDIFCHCDLRVCAEETSFCMPPNRFGFLYPREGMQRLVDVVGATRATQMLLLGEAVPTHDAAAWGLVHKVFAVATFEADLQGFLQVVEGNAPLSMRQTKRVLLAEQRERNAQLQQSSDDMYARMAACLNSADVRESMAAFREKRKPRFTGQ